MIAMVLGLAPPAHASEPPPSQPTEPPAAGPIELPPSLVESGTCTVPLDWQSCLSGIFWGLGNIIEFVVDQTVPVAADALAVQVDTPAVVADAGPWDLVTVGTSIAAGSQWRDSYSWEPRCGPGSNCYFEWVGGGGYTYVQALFYNYRTGGYTLETSEPAECPYRSCKWKSKAWTNRPYIQIVSIIIKEEWEFIRLERSLCSSP